MLGAVVDENSTMSNLTSAISNEASISSTSNINTIIQTTQLQPPNSKKRRNLPGNPDPEAEVVALSPKSLMATNRFVCEICSKGFQRDQNLQLHRRGHNLPWKLKQRSKQEVVRKKVYVCPEPGCVHHDPARALGDLTGIKKHFSRKHGEKKWKCDKCSKKYAVQSDWKAHSKICGTREYRCDCGTLFSRRDSFITHRAFCDALAEESSRSITRDLHNPLHFLSSQTPPINNNQPHIHGGAASAFHHPFIPSLKQENQTTFNVHQLPPWLSPLHEQHHHHQPLFSTSQPSIVQENPNPNTTTTTAAAAAVAGTSTSLMSATALLQKASQMGVTMSTKTGHHHQFSGESSGGLIMNRPHNIQQHVGAPGFYATSSTSTNNTSTAGLLPSREDMGTDLFVHGLASFGNKLANVPTGCMQLQNNNNINNNNNGNSFLAFDQDNFDGMLNQQRNGDYSFQEDAHLIMSTAAVRKAGGGSGGGGGGGAANGGGGDDGMTRDFLGLRGFPDRDFLNMAGFEQMGSSSNNYDDHQQAQNQDPWQS
ncbi:hypothetical protein ABFS82_01G012700 [Erythranthe guttata]|nr:PREDICTED: protein indeterminate-domain 7-like [Erythranthe guttata]|eukprot:XP_012857970.1 PREDICTED: protein indeterminate-domain 7-like [Erythranthe guttata]